MGGRVLVMAVALGLCLTAFVPAAQADWPIIGLIAAVITIGAAVIGVAKWLVEPNKGPDGDGKICEMLKYKRRNADGVVVEEFEKTKYSKSPATIAIPGDFPGLTLPPGYVATESVTVDATVNNDALLTISSADYEANVQNPGITGHLVEYHTERRTDFTLTRPTSASLTDPAELTIQFDMGTISASTTSDAATTGSAGYDLRISSPQLGLLAFSSVVATQDQAPVIVGDIPPAAFATAPGSAVLSDYEDSLTFSIPAGLPFVDIQIQFDTHGQGSKASAAGVPTLSQWGVIAAGSLLLVLGVVTVFRRRA